MPLELFVPKAFNAKHTAIINAANSIITRYRAQGYDLSLRQLYYQFVSANLLENTERNYKLLGSVINDGRLAGLIDWGAIKDRGRVPVIPSHWDDPADMLRAAAHSHRIDKWEDQPAYVEVFVEKQALEGVLVPVCRTLDIPFTANKGYSSASAMYEASKRYLRARRDGKELYVLYLGDHDPSGIDMSRDVDERLTLFLGGYGIELNRLALNMDQIEEYDPPPNPAKLTDSRANNYIDNYGDESWELDALEPSVLAALVRDAVVDLRDEDLWDQAVMEEAKQRALLVNLAAEYEKGNLDSFVPDEIDEDDDA